MLKSVPGNLLLLKNIKNAKAHFKRRTSHVLKLIRFGTCEYFNILMQICKFCCSTSFVLDSAHVKFDVSPRPKVRFKRRAFLVLNLILNVTNSIVLPNLHF